MGGGLVQIVTGRFVFLVWHAVVTIVLFFEKIPGIQIEVDQRLSADERRQQFEDIDTWMTAMLTLAIVCMAVEFAGLFSGYTVVHQKHANLVSALAHLGGFLTTLSMVLNGWTVRVYPYVFVLCSLLPAGYDVLWWMFLTFTRKLGPR